MMPECPRAYMVSYKELKLCAKLMVFLVAFVGFLTLVIRISKTLHLSDDQSQETDVCA